MEAMEYLFLMVQWAVLIGLLVATLFGTANLVAGVIATLRGS